MSQSINVLIQSKELYSLCYIELQLPPILRVSNNFNQSVTIERNLKKCLSVVNKCGFQNYHLKGDQPILIAAYLTNQGIAVPVATHAI